MPDGRSLASSADRGLDGFRGFERVRARTLEDQHGYDRRIVDVGVGAVVARTELGAADIFQTHDASRRRVCLMMIFSNWSGSRSGPAP